MQQERSTFMTAIFREGSLTTITLRPQDILSKQLMYGQPITVNTFESVGAEAMRAVVWQKDCGIVMFPPFYSFPDFGASAKRYPPSLFV